MQTYKTTIEKPCLVIEHDSDAESPRVWDINIGYFITCDKRHNSPDDNEDLISLVKTTSQGANNVDSHMELIKRSMLLMNEKVLAIYPVVKHEHGNIHYSLGYKQGFDYSNNGFYIVTDKTLKEYGEIKPEKIEDIIRQEIDEYNHWVNGELYRFTLYDKNGEEVDFSSGYHDIEAIRQNLPEEYKNEDLNQYVI